jgi:hypothetical protein
VVDEPGQEVKIAFGPVGLLGFVLLIAAARKRAPLLAVAAGAAIWADMNVPALRGWKSLRIQAGG